MAVEMEAITRSPREFDRAMRDRAFGELDEPQAIACQELALVLIEGSRERVIVSTTIQPRAAFTADQTTSDAASAAR